MKDKLKQRDMLMPVHRSLSMDQRAEVARLAGCVPGNVKNVCWGLRPISPEMAAALEVVTGGRLSVEMLLPERRWLRVKDRKYPHPDGRPLLDPVGSPARRGRDELSPVTVAPVGG